MFEKELLLLGQRKRIMVFHLGESMPIRKQILLLEEQKILSKELLNKFPKNKIAIDINLVPPYGIEGLTPKIDNNEVIPGIFGVGALALGRLKSIIESTLLKEAAKSKGMKVFDYNIAFETAKEILFGEELIIQR